MKVSEGSGLGKKGSEEIKKMEGEEEEEGTSDDIVAQLNEQ